MSELTLGFDSSGPASRRRIAEGQALPPGASDGGGWDHSSSPPHPRHTVLTWMIQLDRT